MASNFENEIKKYKGLLKKSSTAYTPGVKPTQKDISLQKKLIAAEEQSGRSESDALKQKWYSSSEKKEDKKQGLLRGTLKTLGAPMSAGAGVAEHLLGKGTKSGLLSNIAANVDEEGTYGDILRSYGLSNLVSAPLGFALDIALDPINWAFAGTTALIPRVAVGAKAGITTGTGMVKGAKIAAKSGLLQKAETAGRLVPGLTKRAFSMTNAGKLPELYKKVSMAADVGRTEFEILTNKTWMDMLGHYSGREHFIDKVSRELSKTEKGKEFLDFAKGDAKEWFVNSMGKDIKALDEVDDLVEISNSVGKGTLSGSSDNLFGDLLKADNIKTKASVSDKVVGKEIGEGLYISANPEKVRSASSAENIVRLRKESGSDKIFKKSLKNDLDGAVETLSAEDAIKFDKAKLSEIYSKTGVKRFDEAMSAIIESPKGRKVLKAYANYIGLFKTSKIGGNFTVAASNALVGNLVMTGMAGIDVANMNYLNAMRKATKIVRGKDMKALDELVGDIGWSEFIKQFPTTFKGVFALEPEFILKRERYLQNAITDIVGKIGKGDKNKMSKYYKEGDEILDMFKEMVNIGDMPANYGALRKSVSKTGGVRSGVENRAIREAVSPVTAAMSDDVATTFLSQEVLTGPFTDFVKKVESLAEKTGSPMYKWMHWYLTKPMDAYSKVDQVYRLGLALHLTKNGISEKELRILSRTFGVPETDVIKEASRNVWKLRPAKATELASMIYMNYQAMPGFVKMMRVTPLLGAPFISFAYGMGAITAKTAVNNPAYFNKVRFLMKEISGEKSPLEKEALDSKYYNWLDREGMLKLPFYKENPVYLNMAEKLPYYTLNMFQPSERTYDNRFSGKASALLDALPFLKQPEGQIMLDYAILPLLTGESQGAFGQKLWADDAGVLEKFGRTAQAGVETVVPPLFSAPLGALPESVLPYVPSYRARKTGFAFRGKTAIGAESSDSASELKNKALSSLAGWPTYKINLRNK